MAGSDMTLSEDRANLFRDLQSFEKKFLKRNSESDRAFNSLLCIWEKTSLDLWELGYWQDYFKCGNVALDCAKSLDNVGAQGKLLNELGWAWMEREDFAEARQYFEESLCKFQSIEDADGQCQSLRYLGVLYHRKQRFGSALKYYRQAVKLLVTKGRVAPPHEQIKWAGHEAELHNIMGNLYFKLWDFSTSYRELHLSLNQYRAWGEKFRYYQPGPLLNLGRWYFLQGDCDRARHYYNECLQLSKELHRPDMEAGVLLRLAQLAEAEGNQEEAIRLAQESEAISGRENSQLRDRAAQFKYRVTGKSKRSIRRILSQFKELSLVGLDLAIAAPATTLRALQHYLTRHLRLKINRLAKTFVWGTRSRHGT